MTTNKELLEENARLTAELGVFKTLYEAEREATIRLRMELQVAQSGATGAQPAERVGVLLRGISTMTMKQRAVAFATLNGESYRDIATVLGVDQTTVKLHLKAALAKLGGIGRAEFLKHASDVIAGIEQMGGAAQVFGVPIDWTTSRPPALMEQLAPRGGNHVPPPPAAKLGIKAIQRKDMTK